MILTGMLSIESLPWVEDKVLRYCVWAKEIMDQFKTPAEYLRFVRLWLIWNNRHGFIHLFGDPPTGVIIWRPCDTFSLELAKLTFFELAGECLWVDFLWAPEQWPTVSAWLISTGKRYGGWQRRENFKVHTVDIQKLCSRHINRHVQFSRDTGAGEHCALAGRDT